MKQKHFMDISRIKEEDSELCISNTGGFQPGNQIVIQEKVDGANASIRYDTEAGKLIAFSRKQELSYDKTLNGFWNYVQLLDASKYEPYMDYVFFGEWLLKNAIKYKAEAYSHWYVYDVYDLNSEQYLTQKNVKKLCEELNLIYVKTFYTGEFISWEHCKTFVGKSDIAIDLGEGIVIKNQTKLNSPDERVPFVLKIVGDHFKEVQKSSHREKIEDPQKLKVKAEAMNIVEQIVTKRRVEKELFKMRDEGLLPVKIKPEDMKTIAQNLPKRIYDDCVKEEQEMVVAAGEYFGKFCGVQAMKFAKEVVLGNS